MCRQIPYPTTALTRRSITLWRVSRIGKLSGRAMSRASTTTQHCSLAHLPRPTKSCVTFSAHHRQICIVLPTTSSSLVQAFLRNQKIVSFRVRRTSLALRSVLPSVEVPSSMLLLRVIVMPLRTSLPHSMCASVTRPRIPSFIITFGVLVRLKTTGTGLIPRPLRYARIRRAAKRCQLI